MGSSDSGLCEICEIEQATCKCGVCGRMVCSRDYDFEKKVCLACRDALCSFCGSKLSIRYCRICGRIGCSDCLIQESLVSYVCRECIRGGNREPRGLGSVENR